VLNPSIVPWVVMMVSVSLGRVSTKVPLMVALFVWSAALGKIFTMEISGSSTSL
jgi:hypothetical protein